jgi:DNA-binding beta-propeller fold protein YncE
MLDFRLQTADCASLQAARRPRRPQTVDRRRSELSCSLALLVSCFFFLAGGCAAEQSAKPDTHPAAFWPPYPDEPRIQFLVSFQRNIDVEAPESALDKLIYGKEPRPLLTINKPYGVGMWQGKIYVCDLRSGYVTILDLRQHRVLVMGKEGDGLQHPTAIVIAPDGMKYVADVGKNVIAVYDAQDHHVGNLGHNDLKPVDVAVYQDELYVSDFKTQRVEVMNRRTGEVLRTIGEPGGDPGQFVRPLGLAVDREGNLFVADVFRCVIQKFDRQGKLVATFAGNSASVGGLVRPKHMVIDRDGILYVVDASFQNVQLYDDQGRVLTYFGSAGDHPGAMYLPAGICVDDADVDLFKQYVHPAFEAQRLIVVTNQFGDNKVSVYALGHLRPGKTVADIAASKGLVNLGVASTQPSLMPTPTTLPAEDDLRAPSTRPADPDR